MRSTLASENVAMLASPMGTYTDRTSFIAAYLGRQISDCRGAESIEDTAIRVLDEHEVEISSLTAARISELVLLDTVYGSEERMATRAAHAVLSETFGDTMRVTGWISGRLIVVHGETFTTTTETCPQCEVNPLCHGNAGGGLRCLNTRECGYGFCF